ncbi:hypothetical protein BLNAU_20929 [Blattamonas nauphoetae]|uniref:Uncharacterized protein n=1 Tax=Blattamonas nauphoetae TaxID=2049346 RepID=A0ABQ9WXC5_9EUKA|nr:hypothetical protein BLNAU_20929 [Blattamonas nauphoetae]
MFLPPKTRAAFCFDHKVIEACHLRRTTVYIARRRSISAQSTTLPRESLNPTENAIVRRIYEVLNVVISLLTNSDITYQNILIDCEFVPLLESIIIICLNLLRQLKCESNTPSDRSDALINILELSWYGASYCISHGENTFRPVIESTFSDIPRLCSLLERTCSHNSRNYHSHLNLLVNLTAGFPRFLPPLLEENLVQRVINSSKPMVVPTTNGEFHLNLIWTVIYFIWNFKDTTEDNEKRKGVRKMQFERVLKPAKQYLQFILQREEFIPKNVTYDKDLSTGIVNLLYRTFLLERELFEDGELVETGREEWEVGWLVEKTDEESLALRLKKIRVDDETTRRDENERWKKRVWRQREAGHEDAMEGWLTRVNENTLSEIVEYLESVNEESGMNTTQ